MWEMWLNDHDAAAGGGDLLAVDPGPAGDREQRRLQDRHRERERPAALLLELANRHGFLRRWGRPAAGDRGSVGPQQATPSGGRIGVMKRPHVRRPGAREGARRRQVPAAGARRRPAAAASPPRSRSTPSPRALATPPGSPRSWSSPTTPGSPPSWRELGCRVVPDGVTATSTRASRRPLPAVRDRQPAARPVALCADLPACARRPRDALPRRARRRGGVRRGRRRHRAPRCTPRRTTLRARVRPASAARTCAAGRGGDWSGELPTLRRDVDDESTRCVARHAARASAGSPQDVVTVLGTGA